MRHISCHDKVSGQFYVYNGPKKLTSMFKLRFKHSLTTSVSYTEFHTKTVAFFIWTLSLDRTICNKIPTSKFSKADGWTDPNTNLIGMEEALIANAEICVTKFVDSTGWHVT